LRKALPVLAALRAVLAVAAIPLAPFLYREHAAVLVLLRPTKETLLFVGYLAHRGDVSPVVAVLAALPLLVPGVWVFFALGREHGTSRELPGLLGRLLPQKRTKQLSDALEEHGDKVIFLGRLAAMPSTLVAAAAGASDLDTRRFLLFDGIGAAVSLALMLGLGWVLDDAYEAAGPWLTALGAVALGAAAVIIGRSLSHGRAARSGGRASASR
jgi:membrane protein DedA with SNARE-associated domain